ncbi:MAG: polysaccharide biosynthesis protein PslG [Solirubrobacteraceae bacterium]|nr:polysaccharide biosynthesis protein PslG [Solirubrobacteraceae bacterium]
MSSLFNHRKRGLLVGLLMLLGLCIPAASAQAAAAPPGFFGLGNWSMPTAAQSAQLGQAGLHSFRAGLVWDVVEHTQGNRNWYYTDTLITRAAQDGYDVTLDINGCVVWVCGATRVPPAPGDQQVQFENFVAAAVARYGATGSFWAEHPDLTRRTVSWQVWNEVNTGADFPNPTPAAYAQLLALTHDTIKGVDPTATVVMSGLTEFPGDDTGQTLTKFLTGLYEQPGFASSFDVAAVHGYSSSPAGVVRILDAARSIMVANGDSAKPLWITEMGWASSGPAHPFTTDTAGQAAELSTSFDQLLACRSRWNLARVLWFSVDDSNADSPSDDYWGLHTGLFNPDGTAKPAYDAFTQYTSGETLPSGRADSCTLPAATDPSAQTQAPASDGGPASGTALPTTITRAPRRLTKSNRSRVTFAAAAEASGFQCSVDAATWQPCAASFVVRTKRQGRHTLSVRAVTATGTVGQASAPVRWIVDRTRPTSKIRSHRVSRAGRAVLHIKGKDARGIAGYRCRVDRHGWKPCKGRVSMKLGRGRHVIQVRARDRAGNTQRKSTRLVLRIV